MAAHITFLIVVIFLLAVSTGSSAANIACTNWKVAKGSGARPELTIPSGAAVRTYYIAAEETQWNYLPMGFDNCDNFRFPPDAAAALTKNFTKAVFREYTNNFKAAKPRPAEEAHLGILGPIIRAEEGEYIRVVLRNNLQFDINLEPSGVLYSEPAIAKPGQTKTYIWAAPTSTSACNPKGDTSQMWHYRSTVDPVAHNAAGLFGPIVITTRGKARADARPKNVDRELFIVFKRFDECLVPVSIRDPTLNCPLEDTQMPHTMNGLSFCNLPGLDAKFGQKVRWYVMGLGNEDDVHVSHWHGITVSQRDRRNADSLFILPGVTHTVDSIADNPGTWLYHCHVNHHLGQGMGALYSITGRPPYKTAPGPAPGGRVRKYYIAAEMVEWDFAPEGQDLCARPPAPFTPEQEVFTKAVSPSRIGTKYLKALYVEYTDATFKTKKARKADQEHLGLLGPLIYAEVGDLIRVTFKNNIAGHNVSVHPHGVLYAKDAEGAPYNDGTSGALKLDDIVQPGATYVYNWGVPNRAGPGPTDPSSLMWMYHSHTDEAMDTWAGLMGAIIITRNGMGKADGSPKDVDRELVLLFSVVDESSSFLLAENAIKYLGADASLLSQVEAARDPTVPFFLNGPELQTQLVLNALFPNGFGEAESDGFKEHNLKHSINGYLYCNMPGLTTSLGQKTRVYFMTFGDAIDLHSPTVFTGVWEEDGRSSQALTLLPGFMQTTDLSPAASGSWIIQCNVHDHITAGMRARIAVAGGGRAALTAAANNAASSGVLRTYYISAEKVEWDYAPLGVDGCTGNAFSPTQQLYTRQFLGSKYIKARYIQYTDDTFTTAVTQPTTDGILGPQIRAEVGDVVQIVYRNMLPFNSSLVFKGGLVPVTARFGPAGRLIAGAESVAAVLAAGVPGNGSQATFKWFVPPQAGPKKLDPSGVVGYSYVSGVDTIVQTHAGLVGVAEVGARSCFRAGSGKGRVYGVPRRADFVYPTMFFIYDELQSPFFQENFARSGLPDSVLADSDFAESSLKHTINGRLYCNLDAISIQENTQGLVVLAGLGSEKDMHSPLFEGMQLEFADDGVLVEGLMPAVTKVATVTPGVRGKQYSGYCYVHDHYTAGMRIKLEVVA